MSQPLAHASRSDLAGLGGLAGRFHPLRLALTAETPGALDRLATFAAHALAEGDLPLAAASAGVVVLAEHLQWTRHHHTPRMLGVLAAAGPDAAAQGADGLLAWAGAAVAHDYGMLPSWPRADIGMLMERCQHAPTDVALALGCALVELCERNGEDAECAALQAQLAGFEVQPVASAYWRGHLGIVCAWYLYSCGKDEQASQRLLAAEALAATYGLANLGATVALNRARLVEWRRDPDLACVLVDRAAALGDPARTPLWFADQADVRCRVALGARDFHAALGHARGAVGYVQAAAAWPSYQVPYRNNEAYALLGAGAIDEALLCFQSIAETPMPHYQAARLKCLAELAVLSAADQRGTWDAPQQHGLARLLQRLRELEWPGVLPLLPEHIARLYARALSDGVDVDWVRAAIRTRKLPAPRGAPQAWPWSVTVQALGPFQVLTDAGPLHPAAGDARKASSKPLELLRFLSVRGHDAVPVDEVAAALWPGDGREGRQKAFDITLSRLRRLLGNAAALTLNDRRVRLNPQCVWVDVQALVQRLAEGEAAAEGSPAARSALEGALALYRGPCLADCREAWATGARERLRSRLAAALLRALRGPGVSASQRTEWSLRAAAADQQLGELLALS